MCWQDLAFNNQLGPICLNSQPSKTFIFLCYIKICLKKGRFIKEIKSRLTVVLRLARKIRFLDWCEDFLKFFSAQNLISSNDLQNSSYPKRQPEISSVYLKGFFLHMLHYFFLEMVFKRMLNSMAFKTASSRNIFWRKLQKITWTTEINGNENFLCLFDLITRDGSQK